MAEDIGARLAAIRGLYGLSQRELAKRAGVTNGTISLIEAEKTSPQISSLRKILLAFPMSIAEFFTFDIKQAHKAFYAADELPEIGSGKISFKLVASDISGRSLQIVHERYRPGADTGREFLSHEGQEGGVIVSGNLEVTVGSQTRVLRAGDAYYFNSRLPHRFRNPGQEVCVVVSAATPPSF
jgi:transcriptional regulator with XRE-family HTH domain